MALHLFSAWRCEENAFSTSSEKKAETKNFVSHRIVNPEAAKDLEAVADSYDIILSTVITPLDWMLYIEI